MKYLFVIIGLMLSYFTNGQQVSQIFEHVEIEEKFTENSTTWPAIYNSEGVAIAQPGKYEMRRANAETGNFVFPKLADNLKSFEVIMNMEFSKKTAKTAIAGIMLKADENSGSGILFEIRKDRSYRITRITETAKIYYTDLEANGWITNKKLIKSKGGILTIKTHAKKYDLYFNNNFLYSFSEFQFEQGKFAFYVGPQSHIFIKSVVVKTFPPNLENNSNITEQQVSEIQELRKVLKIKENEIIRLQGMKVNDEKNIAEIKVLNQQKLNLNNVILQKNEKIDSVRKENEELKYFKNTLTNGENGLEIELLSEKLGQLRNEKANLINQNNQINAELTLQKNTSDSLFYLNQSKGKGIQVLEKEIQFLIRQIDWQNAQITADSAQLNSPDSLRKIERLRNGNGSINNFLQMPLKMHPKTEFKYSWAATTKENL